MYHVDPSSLLSSRPLRADGATAWPIAESSEDIHALYAAGFLPAFLPLASHCRLFYQAPRSVRVDMRRFSPSSENRRILRKTEQFSFSVRLKEEFQYDPIVVGKFCKDYFDAKFGKGVMSVSRIKRIFHAPMTSHVFTFFREGRRVGYVAAFLSDVLFHYAFAFYDLALYRENLGMSMMTQSVVWAQSEGKRFMYLGSVRDEKGLYKAQFPGWEFWDGTQWVNDKEELRRRIRADQEPRDKSSQEKE